MATEFLKQLSEGYVEVECAIRQCKVAAALWLSPLGCDEEELVIITARSHCTKPHLLSEATEIPSSEAAAKGTSSSGKKKSKPISSSTPSEYTVSALLYFWPRRSRTPKLICKGANARDRLGAVTLLHSMLEVYISGIAAGHIARAFKAGLAITQEELKKTCIFVKPDELCAWVKAARKGKGDEGAAGAGTGTGIGTGEGPPPYEVGAVFESSFLEGIQM